MSEHTGNVTSRSARLALEAVERMRGESPPLPDRHDRPTGPGWWIQLDGEEKELWYYDADESVVARRGSNIWYYGPLPLDPKVTP